MTLFEDYGNLTDILLGVAENYQPHVWGWKSNVKSKDNENDNFQKAIALAASAIPDEIRQEVVDDLEVFQTSLQSLGVDVTRPPADFFTETTETPHYLAWGNDFYNMRDLQIVLGGSLLASSPSSPSRVAETGRLRGFLSGVAEAKGLIFRSAPVPELRANPVEELVLSDGGLVPYELEKGLELGGDYPPIWHRLKEDEVLFDAANIAKCGNGLIFLISSTANRRAFDWVSDAFRNQVAIEGTDVYRSSHIDSTIMPLSEDTVLVNAARVGQSNLPKTLENHRILYFADVSPIPDSEVQFHASRQQIAAEITALGFHSNLAEMSSPWAGMNVLSLRTDLVAVESNQLPLIKFLEANGFDVMPVRLRHPYTFLGGLHCTTLDLKKI